MKANALSQPSAYIPNFQSQSYVKALNSFKMQCKMAGIESSDSESDESTKEWRPAEQLYNPVIKKVKDRKVNVLVPTKDFEWYSTSSSSSEVVVSSNRLILSEEEEDWMTVSNKSNNYMNRQSLILTSEESEWMYGSEQESNETKANRLALSKEELDWIMENP